MNILENKKINIDAINDINMLPKVLFENPKSQDTFWDDEHISKQMLDAHLNPDWDAASRKQKTIEMTCEWINSQIHTDDRTKLLDLGCGPGLYCSILNDKGIDVTGIDYSRRSIEYAKKDAILNGRQIEYIYQDYLKINYKQEYDAAIMIYCDFGVLSNSNRKTLLKNVHTALKDDGYFIFDIWSTSHNRHKQKYKTWTINQDGGFWSKTPYIQLVNKVYYESDNVSLEQDIIIKETGEMQVYNRWEQLYTPDSISKLLNTCGFELIEIYSNLTGEKYQHSSEVLGVVARKRNV